MSSLLTPPLSLYVHLPWCVRKCPYCDFNSHPVNGDIPERQYIDALLCDLQAQSPRVAAREICSIFMGGGTPSLFAPAAIGRLIDGIRSAVGCARDLEITLEANPGTIERGRFAEYKASGVSRVSLGGQSFNPRHLQALGRIHSSTDTLAAVNELHAAGLTNFNIDLMYGLPEQTLEEAEADVRAALALGPAHLSHYQLTLEPGTPFHHRPPRLPDEDVCWDMQVRCQALLAQHGFAQYETSAYAPPENRCRHNLNYWRFGDYLGIGAGAHGKLTDAAAATIVRTARPKHPRRYLDDSAAGRDSLEVTPVPTEELPFEFMLNALRLVHGFTVADFEHRTGLELRQIDEPLQVAIERGLLERVGPAPQPASSTAGGVGSPAYRPTPFGARFLNELQLLFLAPAGDKQKTNKTVINL